MTKPKSKRAAPGTATPGTRSDVAPGMVIVIDSREQTPLTFGVPTIVKALPAADYSIVGMEERFAIERKQLSDLHSTLISDRARFVRELELLRSYEFAAILVEGSLRDVLYYRPDQRHVGTRSRASVEADGRRMVNSLVSWSLTYGVRILYCDKDRAMCAAMVLRTAERFWRMKQEPWGSPGGNGQADSEPGFA